MKIETKFNVGEEVFTIENNGIQKFPVKDIQVHVTAFTKIRYALLKSRSVNFGDNDSVTTKDEEECFKSLNDMIEYYNQKIIKDK